jgi:hypothetical protein
VRGVRLGTSTGYMTAIRGDWERLTQAASKTSRSAIELSALSLAELPRLASFLRSRGSLSFEYVSVHAPTKGLTSGAPDYLNVLRRLPKYVQAIIFHPDTVNEPAKLRALGGRVVFENMDTRKARGQTPESLDDLFHALPGAGFCLDLAHASGVDPTLELAVRLLERYGSRLREVHLSSLDENGKHVSLTWPDSQRFARILNRCRHVPWILEAPPPSAAGRAEVNAA